jgi:hypothetical protein
MRAFVRLILAGALALVALPGALTRAQESTPTLHPSDTGPGEGAGTGYTWTAVLDKGSVQPILGKDVRSPTGENMGRIVDVIVDRSGQTRAAVIDFGGFLGVGSRRIVVDWNALHFASKSQNDQITVNLTRDQVKAAPEFKAGRPVIMMGALGGSGPEM